MDMHMDHNHSAHSGVPAVVEGDGHGGGDTGGHHNHVPYFLNDMDQGEEEKLLEMLHVPILHGGVKEVLLLAQLSTDTPASFALACIVLVVCVILLELFRMLLWWVEAKYSGSGALMGASCGCKQCNSLTACIGERKQYDAIHDANSPRSEGSPSHLEITTQSKTSRWLSFACIGGLQFLIYLVSTFLMLIAMTMNIHLIISMAFGAMLGKLTVVSVKKKLMDAHK